VLAVALDGDTLAFNALPIVDDPEQAVHVFRRSDGTWAPEVTLLADQRGELFGAALALQGSTLLVGDPHEGRDTRSAFSTIPLGAVYVFERASDGSWAQDAFLQGTESAGDVGFGGTVAIDCDRIVVGNPADNTNGSGIDGPIGQSSANDDDSGAAYVFARGNGYPLLDYVKSTTGSQRQKFFGASVAAHSSRVLIGARGENAAYVFH
jgi:hypothetical protein